MARHGWRPRVRHRTRNRHSRKTRRTMRISFTSTLAALLVTSFSVIRSLSNILYPCAFCPAGICSAGMPWQPRAAMSACSSSSFLMSWPSTVATTSGRGAAGAWSGFNRAARSPGKAGGAAGAFFAVAPSAGAGLAGAPSGFGGSLFGRHRPLVRRLPVRRELLARQGRERVKPRALRLREPRAHSVCKRSIPEALVRLVGRR